MIDGPKRFFEMRGAVFSNFQQAVGKCDSAFPTGAFQALTNRLRDCFRHAFSRKLGQLVRESVRFLVLDVEAHKGTILPSFSTLLPIQRQGERFSAPVRPYPLYGCCSTVANRLGRVEGSPEMVFLREGFQNDPL